MTDRRNPKDAVTSYYENRWGHLETPVMEIGFIEADLHEVNYGQDIVLNYAHAVGIVPEFVTNQCNFTKSYSHFRTSGTLFQIGDRQYLVLETGRVCEYLLK